VKGSIYCQIVFMLFTNWREGFFMMYSSNQATNHQSFNSSDCFLRLTQIIGQSEVSLEQAEANRQSGTPPFKPRPYIKPIVPVSKSAWLVGVKDGTFPKPVKLGRTTVWRESDVMALFCSTNEVC
jgi:prophage regulatory protein